MRCAPPANKPTPDERDTCLPYLVRELALLDRRARDRRARASSPTTSSARLLGVRPRPRFGHGVEVAVADGRTLVCSFHPSQQNTFTGKLTEPMFDAVFARASSR